MPSPVEEQPGLLIRDSRGYSDAILIVPPPLVACLELINGENTGLDLRELLVRITGDLAVGDIETQLLEALSTAGFLHDDVYAALREAREREFRESAVREPSHAGSAYPDQPQQVRETLGAWMRDTAGEEESGGLIAIAAPHVSPAGGWQTYRAAYGALGPQHRDRVFIVLGTSHYGEPDRFGLTRKPFVTPLGQTVPDLSIINELASEPAVLMEDYCHAVEHSIEFQVLFLQYLYGPDIRVVPVLCGSFARSILQGGKPEDNDDVHRFLSHLAEIGAREDKRLMWVLGIDMAHMGMRYGDGWTALAGQDRMAGVAERDNSRIASINAGDARGFWEKVQANQDDLKWCGSSPVYTFMKAMPDARGMLRGYEQWNIDERSVVSFAAMSFRNRP